jgi:hypothetical protein
MKPKKEQKRYAAAFDVDVEIFAQQRKAAKLEAEAKAEDAKADVIYKKLNSTPDLQGYEIEHGRQVASEHRRKAERLRKRINSINDIKLKQLKETKSVVQTPVFGFVDDNSTPLIP